MVTVKHDLSCCRILIVPPSQNLLRSVAVVGGGGPAGGREAGTEGSVSLPSPRPAGCHLPSPPTRRAEDAWSTGRERRGNSWSGGLLGGCSMGGRGEQQRSAVCCLSSPSHHHSSQLFSSHNSTNVQWYSWFDHRRIDLQRINILLLMNVILWAIGVDLCRPPGPQTAKYHQHLTTITTVVFPG